MVRRFTLVSRRGTTYHRAAPIVRKVAALAAGAAPERCLRPSHFVSVRSFAARSPP